MAERLDRVTGPDDGRTGRRTGRRCRTRGAAGAGCRTPGWRTSPGSARRPSTASDGDVSPRDILRFGRATVFRHARRGLVESEASWTQALGRWLEPPDSLAHRRVRPAPRVRGLDRPRAGAALTAQSWGVGWHRAGTECEAPPRPAAAAPGRPGRPGSVPSRSSSCRGCVSVVETYSSWRSTSISSVIGPRHRTTALERGLAAPVTNHPDSTPPPAEQVEVDRRASDTEASTPSRERRHRARHLAPGPLRRPSSRVSSTSGALGSSLLREITSGSEHADPG